MFIRFLNSPINIANKFQIKCIQYQKYNKALSINNSEICINSCQFIDCKNSGEYARGGAIRFECLNSNLTVHGTAFENCTSVACGGAIFACGSEKFSFDSNSYLMTHENMNYFNSHYCCYSGCSAQIYVKTDDSNMRYSGYGSAILVASDNIELNYSASSNCPRIESSHAYGAQFDIKTKEVKSCFINATKGDSICCAAIEYRNAKVGFFSYQTIVNQVGSFITSFSSLEGSINITSCNLVNNTLRYISNVDLCSLIYVMYKNVVISNFVVTFSKVDQSIEQKGLKAHFAAANSKDLTVTVENCQIDQSMANSDYFTDVKTTNVLITEKPSTISIGLLKLGDCAGIVEPPPIFVTSYFTQTAKFSSSDAFSKSAIFTSTAKFNQTHEFSESKRFTRSENFTFSAQYSSSIFFSLTQDFTKSGGFSESTKFTQSNFFSTFSEFTKTGGFSSTNEFNETLPFLATGKFSKSKFFSPSHHFTSTTEFSKSNHFTSPPSSLHFTPSCEFSETMGFSHSNILAIIKIQDSMKKEKASNAPLIGGIIGGVAGVAAISGTTIFLMKWRKSSQIEFEIQEPSNASSSEVIIQNPLYRQNMEDDPFQNDFAEHLASLDTVL